MRLALIQRREKTFEIHIDEPMDSESVSNTVLTVGPDLERFLNDAVAATAIFARENRSNSTYGIPPYPHNSERNKANCDVEGPVSSKFSVFERPVSCCYGGRRTTTVIPDPKNTIVQARGWKTAPFILGCEIGERLGSTAISYNLIVYLTRNLNLPLVKAVYISSASFGASSLAPFLGNFLVDAYLGRFTTLAAGSIIYLGGLVIFTLLLSVPNLRPRGCNGDAVVSDSINTFCDEANSFQMTILFLSLTLQIMGSGAMRPCTALYGADQFDESNPEQRRQIQNFLSWHKVCMASAMIVAVTVVIWIQTYVNRSWGSLILSVTMGLSLSAFLFGMPFYRTLDAHGSPLTSLVQVLVTSIRKRKLSLPEDPNLLHQGKSQGLTSDALLHTENMRWLDKAAVLESWEEDAIDRCTVQQVEELKKILRMAPVWLCASVSAIVYIQTFTIMTEQVMTMDLSVASHFKAPPASMGVFSILTFLLFVPFYNTCLRKVLRNLTGPRKGLTSLQRIGVGIFLGILTMSVGATLESKRKDVARKSNMFFEDNAKLQEPLPISAFWLVPQFILAGLGESFVVRGLLEFFNDETPSRLQGMGQSFVWAALGMGGVLNTILVAFLQRVTMLGTGEANGWFNDNINRGRLHYFYITLAILGVVVFLIYVFIAASCTFTVKNELELAHTKLNTTGTGTIDDPL